MLKASLTIYLTVLSLDALSHPAPSDMEPISAQGAKSSNYLSNGAIYGDTTGGYGFLCSGKFCSEAEAVNKLDLSCDPKETGNLIKKLCPGYGLDLPSNSSAIQNLERISSKTFLKHLQENLFEYLKLSSISNPHRINMEKKNKVELDLETDDLIEELFPGMAEYSNSMISVQDLEPRADYSCIGKTDKFLLLGNEEFSIYPPTQKNIFDSKTTIEFEASDEIRGPIEEKAGALNQRFHPENVVRAITYDKFLDHWENVYSKSKDPGMYESIQSQKRKIRQSYPHLFNGQGKYHPETTNIMDKVYSALGVSGQRVSKSTIDFSNSKEIGKKIFMEKAKSKNRAYPDILKELFENINYIGDVAASNKDESTPESSFFGGIDSELNKLGKRLLKEEGQDRTRICELSIKNIAEKYPNVLRQSLLEMKGKNLDVAKFVMCKKGIAKDFRKPIECGKTSGNINSPEGKNFEVLKSNFPYGGAKGKNINVRTLPDGTLVVKKKIQLVDKGGIKEGEIKCLSTRVENAMNRDLNCQIGAPGVEEKLQVSPMGKPLCTKRLASNTSEGSILRNCPTPPNEKRDPGVKFEVELEFVSDDSSEKGDDVINIYKCYRSEIDDKTKAGDCREVQKYNVQICKESFGVGYGECHKILRTEDLYEKRLDLCCNKNVAERMGRGELFRQNAANMTPGGNRGVWYHEILHTMGLDDEYSDGTYPMTDLGDYNSIMRSASSNDAIIHPRHVDRILKRVKECR